ncbi:MAG: hypothetical protein NT069_01525, partial [Planctomycetota bacterium]|nr:hypothetical protein [Planctomycetota bacterium]
DPVYSGIDPADISVINLDDDQLPNDAPTLAGAATLIYTEQQATVPAINAGVTVADVDNLALTSATIRITANYLAGEDLIEFTSATTTGNITAQFDSGTGTLTLDSAGATATIAQFQAALARVTYRNTSSNPSTAPRSVEYRVSDGTLWSNRLVNLVTIVAVNDLPVLAGSSTLNYTEKQTATVINPTITVSDSDSSGLAWATVAISTNFATGQDLLEFVPDGTTGNLAGTYNATSGVLTLISTDRTATPAQVQSALQRVTYRNSSANPTLLTRSVSFKVSDGIGQSATSISTIGITPTNDAPTLSWASPLICAKNQVATAVNAAITVADVDNTTFTSATVRIAVGYSSGNDLLEFTPTTATGNVVGAYDVDTGTMTLTSPGGTATAAQFQAALARVTYRNTSGTPTVAPRSVEYQIFDATLGSNVITSLITIKGTGPAPTLATGGSRGYTELQAPVVINPSVVVADTDSATLAWATVKISTNFAAGQDQLSFAGSGATGNIQGAYNAKTGILTLISAGATATKSEFQSALRQVTYSNSSANPSKLTRSITFQVCDGTTASNSLVNSIAFTALNDAPVLMGLSGLIFTENQAATPAMNAGIVVSDVDNLTLASATVRFATNYLPGEDVLGFVAGTTTGNIVAAFDTNTGVLTLSSAGATATIAQFQAALR